MSEVSKAHEKELEDMNAANVIGAEGPTAKVTYGCQGLLDKGLTKSGQNLDK